MRLTMFLMKEIEGPTEQEVWGRSRSLHTLQRFSDLCFEIIVIPYQVKAFYNTCIIIRWDHGIRQMSLQTVRYLRVFKGHRKP